MVCISLETNRFVGVDMIRDNYDIESEYIYDHDYVLRITITRKKKEFKLKLQKVKLMIPFNLPLKLSDKLRVQSLFVFFYLNS